MFQRTHPVLLLKFLISTFSPQKRTPICFSFFKKPVGDDFCFGWSNCGTSVDSWSELLVGIIIERRQEAAGLVSEFPHLRERMFCSIRSNLIIQFNDFEFGSTKWPNYLWWIKDILEGHVQRFNRLRIQHSLKLTRCIQTQKKWSNILIVLQIYEALGTYMVYLHGCFISKVTKKGQICANSMLCLFFVKCAKCFPQNPEVCRQIPYQNGCIIYSFFERGNRE